MTVPKGMSCGQEKCRCHRTAESGASERKPKPEAEAIERAPSKRDRHRATEGSLQKPLFCQRQNRRRRRLNHSIWTKTDGGESGYAESGDAGGWTEGAVAEAMKLP